MIPLILIPGHLCGQWLYPEGMVPDGFDVLPLADTTQDDDIGAMADRVLASGPDRFAVAGLSMGGMVAMELMARAPDRILGACLMDTDPTPARPREIEWRNGLIDQGLAVYAQTFVSRFFLHDPAAPLAGVVLDHMQSVPGRIARAQARALDARRNMAPLISDFAGPVEVVVGADDRVCPPRLHRDLCDALPGARATEIPDCGHLATLEHPKIVSDVLQRLAGRIDAARQG